VCPPAGGHRLVRSGRPRLGAPPRPPRAVSWQPSLNCTPCRARRAARAPQPPPRCAAPRAGPPVTAPRRAPAGPQQRRRRAPPPPRNSLRPVSPSRPHDCRGLTYHLSRAPACQAKTPHARARAAPAPRRCAPGLPAAPRRPSASSLLQCHRASAAEDGRPPNGAAHSKRPQPQRGIHQPPRPRGPQRPHAPGPRHPAPPSVVAARTQPARRGLWGGRAAPRRRPRRCWARAHAPRTLCATIAAAASSTLHVTPPAPLHPHPLHPPASLFASPSPPPEPGGPAPAAARAGPRAAPRGRARPPPPRCAPPASRTASRARPCTPRAAPAPTPHREKGRAPACSGPRCPTHTIPTRRRCPEERPPICKSARARPGPAAARARASVHHPSPAGPAPPAHRARAGLRRPGRRSTAQRPFPPSPHHPLMRRAAIKMGPHLRKRRAGGAQACTRVRARALPTGP
jgi:hypothetical protein